jgi:Tfp pilus assembly protein PilX
MVCFDLEGMNVGNGEPVRGVSMYVSLASIIVVTLVTIGFSGSVES